MTDVTLPNFGLATVAQTAVVHGALAAQADRYESGKALQDGQAVTGVFEGFTSLLNEYAWLSVAANEVDLGDERRGDDGTQLEQLVRSGVDC